MNIIHRIIQSVFFASSTVRATRFLVLKSPISFSDVLMIYDVMFPLYLSVTLIGLVFELANCLM